MSQYGPMRVRSEAADGIVAGYRSDTGSDRICHRTLVGSASVLGTCLVELLAGWDAEFRQLSYKHVNVAALRSE